MARQISEGRKNAYYVGFGLQIVGALLFFSMFVSSIMHFGDFTDFEARVRSEMFRALAGMALIAIGAIVRSVGARGLAGAGVILDPESARDELEPYSRMAGGMIKDALDEADVSVSGQPATVVKVKCRACGRLNDEDAKYCQLCGQPV